MDTVCPAELTVTVSRDTSTSSSFVKMLRMPAIRLFIELLCRLTHASAAAGQRRLGNHRSQPARRPLHAVVRRHGPIATRGYLDLGGLIRRARTNAPAAEP